MIDWLLNTLEKPGATKPLMAAFFGSCSLTILFLYVLPTSWYAPSIPRPPIEPAAFREWIDLGYLRAKLEEDLAMAKINHAVYQQRKNLLIQREDIAVKSFPDDYKEYIYGDTPFEIRIWLNIGSDRNKLERKLTENKISYSEYEVEKRNLISREDEVAKEHPALQSFPKARDRDREVNSSQERATATDTSGSSTLNSSTLPPAIYISIIANILTGIGLVINTKLACLSHNRAEREFKLKKEQAKREREREEREKARAEREKAKEESHIILPKR